MFTKKYSFCFSLPSLSLSLPPSFSSFQYHSSLPLFHISSPFLSTLHFSSMKPHLNNARALWTGANQLSEEHDKSQCIIDNNNYFDMRISTRGANFPQPGEFLKERD